MMIMSRFFALPLMLVVVVHCDHVRSTSRLINVNFTSMTSRSSVFTPVETITGNKTTIHNNTHTVTNNVDVREANVTEVDEGSDQNSEPQDDDMHADATEDAAAEGNVAEDEAADAEGNVAEDEAAEDDAMHDDSMVDDSMAGGDDDFIPEVSPLLDWPEGKCIDNITWIIQDQEMKGPFEMKKYHVCPNRTYEIGLDEVGHCCLENKYAPFLRLRGFSEFICGDDGSASNNCIISGGDVQISSTDLDYPGETTKGVVFRGFTFQRAQFITVLLAGAGDVVFDDCIFKDNKNTGVISLAYAPVVSNRRTKVIGTGSPSFSKAVDNSAMIKYLEPKFAHDHSRREVESNDDFAAKHRLQVTFKNSMFVNNSHGESFMGVEPQGAMIMADPIFQDIVIDSCLFVRNNFYMPDQMSEGFAVRIEEKSTLKMMNTCFLNNDFYGEGVIVLKDSILSEAGAPSGMHNNYVSSEIVSHADCPFAFQESIGSCIQADALTCPIVTVPSPPTTLSFENRSNDTRIGAPSSHGAFTASPVQLTTMIILFTSVVVFL